MAMTLLKSDDSYKRGKSQTNKKEKQRAVARRDSDEGEDEIQGLYVDTVC